MPFEFADPRAYRFQDGNIFLGVDQRGQEVGIETERHAIAVAGAGSGKGAAIIIPNLLRWKAAALCIDPKGENAERTWQAREAMGQVVGVLDPFHAAEVPDRLRVGINVLSGIDPYSRTARGDVETIADGLVKRADPRHAEWDDGAASVLAGVIAYVLADPPPEGATLPLIRRVLLQERDDLYADAQRMLDCPACGGLAKAAGLTIMTALESEKGMEKDFLGGARRHSAWLDDPAIADVLSASTFDLSDLKTGGGSLFLVLPPHYIDSKAAFLRLFVRSALNTMAAGGSGKGGRCLFLLDEFYALGKLDIVAKAAGLMRSYGVSLFPFLQDLGQLQELYGVKGAETFFGNADAHVFFGNSDTVTLQYVSDRIGSRTPQDIGLVPPPSPVTTQLAGEGIDGRNSWISDPEKAKYQDKQALYSHAMKMVGRPRFNTSELAALIGKGNGDKVANSMVVFAKSGDILNLRLAPYFDSRRKVGLISPLDLSHFEARNRMQNPRAVARAEMAMERMRADAEAMLSGSVSQPKGEWIGANQKPPTRVEKVLDWLLDDGPRVVVWPMRVLALPLFLPRILYNEMWWGIELWRRRRANRKQEALDKLE